MGVSRKRPATSGHVFRKIQRGSGVSKLIDGILLKSDTGTGRSAQTVSQMIDRFGLNLCFTCKGCGHQWTPRGVELIALYGVDTPLQDIKPVCPVCGGSEVLSYPVPGS